MCWNSTVQSIEEVATKAYISNPYGVVVVLDGANEYSPLIIYIEGGVYYTYPITHILTHIFERHEIR